MDKTISKFKFFTNVYQHTILSKLLKFTYEHPRFSTVSDNCLQCVILRKFNEILSTAEVIHGAGKMRIIYTCRKKIKERIQGLTEISFQQ